MMEVLILKAQLQKGHFLGLKKAILNVKSPRKEGLLRSVISKSLEGQGPRCLLSNPVLRPISPSTFPFIPWYQISLWIHWSIWNAFLFPWPTWRQELSKVCYLQEISARSRLFCNAVRLKGQWGQSGHLNGDMNTNTYLTRYPTSHYPLESFSADQLIPQIDDAAQGCQRKWGFAPGWR